MIDTQDTRNKAGRIHSSEHGVSVRVTQNKKKSKEFHMECPRCHTKYPGKVKIPVRDKTNQVIEVEARLSSCRTCGTNLIRRKGPLIQKIKSLSDKCVNCGSWFQIFQGKVVCRNCGAKAEMLGYPGWTDE